MLRNIRIFLASFFWVSLVLLFLDFTGTLHCYLGWIAKIQFMPALLATNITIVVSLIVLTLLLGRVYCSVICPLGICQDLASWAAGLKNKNRFSFKPSGKTTKIMRFTLMTVYLLSIIAGITFIAVVLEPYSAFGRMIASLLSPLYLMGNNLLAFLAERMGSYAFYSVDIWLKGMSSLVVAIITFITISIFAWKTGRGYCNLICPIGTILSVFAKFSLVKIRFDKAKCSDCKLCTKNCKSVCIDIEQGSIDYTRCVSCFNCINKCPKGAINYNTKKKNISPVEGNNSRRGFVSGLFLLMVGLFMGKKVHAYEFDGGLTPLENKKNPKRSNPIIPAGADNIRSFKKKCTSCQLCVSVCPNNVLRPSNKLSEFMQPHLSFEKGYCRPECVKCSEVCPNGALLPITPEEKSAIQIGYAVWKPELCVVLTDNVTCDLCAVKCPTAAITLIDQGPNNTNLPKIPMIDDNRCIGCGACENLCPARPYSAIYVEGVDTHRRV